MKIRVDVSGGVNVFFISDIHFFHKNVIRFDDRPFRKESGEADLDLMHETIISNWNSVVKEEDTVFYLGDLTFSRWELAKPLVDQLNGKIHFIMGNHDKYEDIKKYNRFVTINDYVDLHILNGNQKYEFTLMHYPIFSWNKIGYGCFMVHGHCHHNLHHGESADFYVGRRVMDVGCNGINYTPISYQEVVEKLGKIQPKHQ